MPSFAANLEKTLHAALTDAGERRHEYATLEHLLLSLTRKWLRRKKRKLPKRRRPLSLNKRRNLPQNNLRKKLLPWLRAKPIMEIKKRVKPKRRLKVMRPMKVVLMKKKVTMGKLAKEKVKVKGMKIMLLKKVVKRRKRKRAKSERKERMCGKIIEIGIYLTR